MSVCACIDIAYTWKPAERFAGVKIWRFKAIFEIPGRTLSVPRSCKFASGKNFLLANFFSPHIPPVSFYSLSVRCLLLRTLLFFSFAAGDCQTLPESLSVYRLRTSQKLVVYPGIYRTPSQTNRRHHYPIVYDTQLMWTCYCGVPYRMYILQVCRTRVTVCTHRKQGFITNITSYNAYYNPCESNIIYIICVMPTSYWARGKFTPSFEKKNKVQSSFEPI